MSERVTHFRSDTKRQKLQSVLSPYVCVYAFAYPPRWKIALRLYYLLANSSTWDHRNLRSGSIFVSLGETFWREGRPT